MNLVVGATGILGQEIVRMLREAGKPVRAFVRSGPDSSKREALSTRGAELHLGDLKRPDTLEAACREAETVISTASATLSRQDGDGIESVDEQGHLDLVEMAERAGVKRFVFVSFAPLKVDCALQRAKRRVEARLEASSMAYTVLQPVDFMEVWLSAALGFDPANGKARVFGSGEQPVSWVSLFDVARFAVAATENRELERKVLPLGGPDALSPLRVIEIFKELGAPDVAVEFVPEAALEAQLASALDPVQEAFAALMLSTARGYTANPREAVRLVPGRLGTVREYAMKVLKNA
jgi:uncharacterized protein YbjT (DUF2867 family)